MRSLYNNISEIELDFKDSKFVALCFCETWLNNRIMDGLSGYKTARVDRSYHKKGGGLIIYVREDLDFESLENNHDTSNENIELMTNVIKEKIP